MLTAARKHAKHQLDITITVTYYEIGRMIVEREQQGEKRARYGAKLIKDLSEYLTEGLNKGFSAVNLQNMRKFFLVYSPSIGQTVPALSEKGNSQSSGFDASAQKQQTLSATFNLGWSHYQILIRIEDGAARNFYEIETVSQQWSVRQLQRQVGSSLYILQNSQSL